MTRQAIDSALELIAETPGYENIARRLRRTPIRLLPSLVDRAQTSLWGRITLGPEPFTGTEDRVRVSLAATLVHEHFHLRQHPLEKTASFWLGAATHHHPMRRYEAPAYAAQQQFLRALTRSHPALQTLALAELEQVQAAFARHYGPTP